MVRGKWKKCSVVDQGARNFSPPLRAMLWAILLVIILLTVLAMALGIWPGHWPGSARDILQRERYQRILLAAAQQLQDRYETGDREGLIAKNILTCRDVPQSPLVHGEYLKCNPHYLNCFLAGTWPRVNNRFSVQFAGKKYQVKAKQLSRQAEQSQGQGTIAQKYYRIVSKGQFLGKKIPHYAVQLTLVLVNHSEPSLNIVLQDTCRDVYLPQRTYVYREHGRQQGEGAKEYIWHNFNRDIYIDKRLVTFRDIVDWQATGRGREIIVPQDRSQWALPAGNLKIAQMEQYCQFLGKQVTNTLVYDAASFFPIDLKQVNYIDRQFPPLPWSRRKLGPELLALQAKKTASKRNICADIWTQECVSETQLWQSSPRQRTSWVGLRELLGGHPEYLRNPIHPQYNLRVSSFYLKGQSPWHQLGRRGQWTGRGFSPEEFRAQGQKVFFEQQTDIKVGFRCMLDGPGEA